MAAGVNMIPAQEPGSGKYVNEVAGATLGEGGFKAAAAGDVERSP